jgi:PAS domain S-box-containing protein
VGDEVTTGSAPLALWVHVGSRGLITLAYATLFGALVYFLRRRRDIRHYWVFLLFGVFMLTLGVTRGLEIWRVWNPDAGPIEVVEAIAGLLAVPSAVLGVRLIPRGLALPSLEALRASNEAVVASAAQFRALLESAPDAMVISDRHGKIFLVNAAAEQMFGYRRDELIGKSGEILVAERFRPTSPARREAFYADPRQRMMGSDYGLYGQRKDGREFPIEANLSPIATPTGVLISSAIRDLTERKATAIRLRALEVAAQVVEAAPSAMLLIDAERRIALVNRTTCELYGYERDELIGQPLSLLVPRRFLDRHAELMQRIGGDALPRMLGDGAQLFGRRKDGSEVPIEVGTSPLATPDGLCMLASVTDVTERRRAEADLRRSNAELEQFAYIASHDLQEPLRMVASYTELLGQRYRGKLDDKADKYIHYAVDGAKRMQRLVSDLLAYSRVGSQARPPAPIALDAVVARVCELLARPIKETGAVIDYAALPIVLADEGQINQLFQNLIGNAMKFHGAAPPRVTIRARLADDRWEVSVTDAGIGIDMQHADRIFEMFQRLHERGAYDGSGIGLAIAKRIVERHGGRIWVESSPGAGATFRFTLMPAELGAEPARRAATHQEAS